jgi:ubiquinone/menaquinone biosynthesis C-methylase UbiE
MSEQQIRFDDGAGYEQMMGKWSRLAGDVFLDWLQAPKGMNWLDIGCGNGAFTELLIERCAPLAVAGIDPSEGQLAYARERPGCRLAEFQQGDAMSLPYADRSFDAAVMALVIFFVPEPAQGLAEMSRVVRPGGLVSAYAWDILDGGFPLVAIQEQMRSMGKVPMLPPSVEVSRKQVMHQTWVAAGLNEVETTEIRVQRTFKDFEDYWQTALLGSSVGPTIKALAAHDYEALKTGVQQRLEHGSNSGQLVISARANAVRGFVPSSFF